MAYVYADSVRTDILRMIPSDGNVIGSIGCGTGATENVLVKQGRTVHGIDISPEAVAIAEERLTTVRLIKVGDPTPFAKGSLDGLILADVLEHIPDAMQALSVFAEAVRPGGWIVISVPNMRNWEVVKTFFLKGDWPENSVGIFDRTHVQVMSIRRLKRWCNACGLQVEKVFDKYDPFGPRRYRFFRTCDLLTLKIFHNFFMYQVQIRCRR